MHISGALIFTMLVPRFSKPDTSSLWRYAKNPCLGKTQKIPPRFAWRLQTHKTKSGLAPFACRQDRQAQPPSASGDYQHILSNLPNRKISALYTLPVFGAKFPFAYSIFLWQKWKLHVYPDCNRI